MTRHSAKRLGLLVAVMLVLYFAVTSSTMATLVSGTGQALARLIGVTSAPRPAPPAEPPPSTDPSPPTAIVYHAAETDTNPGTTRVTLYFADSDAMVLVPVSRTISLSRTPIRDTLTELIRGPAAPSGLISPFVQMAIRDLALRTDGTLRIDLPTAVVQASTGWGSSASLLALDSLVNTVSEYTEVRRVQFLVGGTTATTLFHGLSTREPIPAQKWQSTGGRMTLYYAIYAGNRAYLVPDQVDVAGSDTRTLMLQALEALKSGKAMGDYQLHATMPQGVEVLGVNINGSTAVVNVNASFADVLTMEPARQMLMLDSVILTLTSFPQVQSVQLLVEGEKLEHTVGKRDLSQPQRRPRWINPE